jgi:Arc/MetJ-type ribon-helix-helix transcriptional regulator
MLIIKKLLNYVYVGDFLMKLVTVKLPEALIDGMDDLVRAGMYPSRSSLIRAAVRDLLRKELWRT